MEPAVLSFADFRSRLSKFFFAPVDTRPAGLVRIGFALVLLIQNLGALPDFYLWYSEHGVLPLGPSRLVTAHSAWTLFSLLPTTDFALTTVFVIFNLAILSLLVGYRSRWSYAIVYVLLVSFNHRNRLILDGQDAVSRMLGFVLLFMPLGASFSVDNVRGRLSASKMEAWPWRMMQLQMTVFMIAAAAWKFRGEDWVAGTALYYVARSQTFFLHLPFPKILFSWMPLVAVMSWGALAIEFFAPVLLWFRETRRAALLALGLLHLSIFYFMHLLSFHFVMVLGWSAFLTPAEWETVGSSLRRGLNKLWRRVPEKRRSGQASIRKAS